MFQIKWTASLDVSNIHLRFLDLIDEVLVYLSTADKLTFNISETCSKLMATNKNCEHQISLFNEKLLDKLNNLNSYFILKMILLPFMTWFDHDLLSHLILASKSEQAKNLLELFDKTIDFNQPITLYPISGPSQLIIPMDDSDYTVVATQCDCTLDNLSLERVVIMKSLLTKQWEITDYSIQLIAIQNEKRLLYWMIPKVLVPVIEQKGFDAQYELLQNGLTMISVFPNNFFSQEITNSIDTDPFCFWNAKVN